MGHGSKLKQKQEKAIAALLSERSVEEAADKAGISARTLHRWLKLSGFQMAHLEARKDVVQQTGARLQKATTAASLTLLKIMMDSTASPAVRLRAAESVIALAFNSIEIEDSQIRITRLEEALAELLQRLSPEASDRQM